MVSSEASGDEQKLDPPHYREDECSFSLLYPAPAIRVLDHLVHARV